MLEIKDLDYRIAGRALLDGASAVVPAGHHVALIGRNGTGKSTLLRLITREIEADGGSIVIPKGTSIGVVAQEAPGGPETPLDVVLEADRERHELLAEAEHVTDPGRAADIQMRLIDIDAHAAPARAATILAGLGFDDTAQSQPMSSFSGGWRMRVALAAALFARPDLLLLDEPTNHLDFESASWLEAYLKRYSATFLLVSHDREFLNAVTDGILHLDQGKLGFYSGNYDNFVRTRREQLAHQQSMSSKQEAERKRIQAFIDRFRAKASKARQAQSRIKALGRLSPIEIAARDPEIRFNFPQPEELAPPIIALDRADAGYEANRPILRGLDLRVDPDDRIALLGANGNGKSTLVKLLAGRLPPLAGERVVSSKLRVGYFAQHQLDELDANESVFQNMARRLNFGPAEKTRAVLGRFGFSQKRVETKVGSLSGGEKARLTLALITADAPHLLILDEPTNHLDIEAREALIEGLADYSGAVILVSHDRHLVDAIADRLWLVADQAARPFDGDLDDYRRQLMSPQRGGGNSRRETEDKRGSNGKTGRPVDATKLKRALARAETDLAALQAEQADIEAALADPKIYGGQRDQLNRLTTRQTDLVRALAAAEARWIEAAAIVEEAELAASA